MARIRTIKPEFWDSPDTAGASFAARLLYIAMWNWADDYGVGTAGTKELLGFAFPNDDSITTAEFPSLLKEVADCFGTAFYVVRGRPFYCIPSWDDHQKTERRAKRRNPLPDDPEAAPDLRFLENLGTSASKQGTSARTEGRSPAGTGEQGNRGTGEVGSELASASSAALPRAASTELAILDEQPSAQTLVAEWIDHCPEKPPGRVIGHVAKELKNLLDEGIDPVRVRRALAEWNRKGLHPSLLPNIVHEIANKAPAAKGQQATNDLFDRAMARAIEAERNAS